jgi:EAL domain-containing protein (putative c-di-GMP-specific phosphodiesterase class I)
MVDPVSRRLGEGDNALGESELLRRADVAMYAAKALGKNQYCRYGPELDSVRNDRIKLAQNLREALATGAIEVAYQPIVDAKSRQVMGVEALARWKGPDGTPVAPDKFISVAEEFGLIDELGRQVLITACREAVAWDNLYLSVNISPVQFRNPNFVAMLTDIVDRSGLPHQRLELELTEGYIIENSDRAKTIIDQLRAKGFRVSLDDFGTGYSSIGYLRKLRFDKLKIDKSIVHGMIDDASARSIILTTVSLATSMNMRVTAEGVELEEEANLLRLAGCETLQGYYFGKPQSAVLIVNKRLETDFPEQAIA